MNLYLDCEFNEFRGELISMALVDEDGRAWVAEHVMPILHKLPNHGERATALDMMARSLQRFLSAYPAVHIVADWPEDIQHFCSVLITGPGVRINTPPLTMEVDRALDAADSLVPHNALADARAIRLKAMAAEQKAGAA